MVFIHICLGCNPNSAWPELEIAKANVHEYEIQWLIWCEFSIATIIGYIATIDTGVGISSKYITTTRTVVVISFKNIMMSHTGVGYPLSI